MFKRNNLWFLLLSCLYIYLLYYFYIVLISPRFSYAGYVVNDLSLYKIVLSYIVAVLPVSMSPDYINKPSDLFFFIIYYIVYIPSVIIPPVVGVIPYDVSFLYSISMMLSLWIFRKTTTSYNLKKKFITINFSQWKILILIISMFFLILFSVYLIYEVFPIIQLVGIDDVYSQRLKGENFILNLNSQLITYALGWLQKIIIPALLLVGVVYRKPFILIVGIVFLVLSYGISAHKSIVGLAVSVLFAYYFFSRYKIHSTHLSIMLLLLVIIGFVFPTWGDLFTRRVIITPGLLSSWYINYCLNMNSVSNILNFRLPYFVAQFNIGRAFDANGNFYATSVVSAGYFFGPIFVGCILSAYMRFYDNISLRLKNIDKKLYLLSLIMSGGFLLGIINTSIFTSLNTHGGIWILIFIYILLCANRKKY